MDKRNLVSVGALGIMVFFAFGSTSTETTMISSDLEAQPVSASAPAAASGGSIGVAECDEYVKRYRCYLDKMGQPTKSADDMEATWKKSWNDMPDIAKEMGRQGMADGCKQSTSSMEAMFSEKGC